MIVINISIETDSASSSNKSIGRSKFSAAYRKLHEMTPDLNSLFLLSEVVYK